MSEVDNMKADSLDTLMKRHRDELTRAIEATKLAQRKAATDAGQAIREDAAEALAETLAEVRRRVAGGSVPVEVRFGALPPELKLALNDAKNALGDEAACVVCVPQVDRYGYREPVAYAVIDVSRLFRG